MLQGETLQRSEAIEHVREASAPGPKALASILKHCKRVHVRRLAEAAELAGSEIERGAARSTLPNLPGVKALKDILQTSQSVHFRVLEIAVFLLGHLYSQSIPKAKDLVTNQLTGDGKMRSLLFSLRAKAAGDSARVLLPFLNDANTQSLDDTHFIDHAVEGLVHVCTRYPQTVEGSVLRELAMLSIKHPNAAGRQKISALLVQLSQVAHGCLRATILRCLSEVCSKEENLKPEILEALSFVAPKPHAQTWLLLLKLAGGKEMTNFRSAGRFQALWGQRGIRFAAMRGLPRVVAAPRSEEKMLIKSCLLEAQDTGDSDLATETLLCLDRLGLDRRTIVRNIKQELDLQGATPQMHWSLTCSHTTPINFKAQP